MRRTPALLLLALAACGPDPAPTQPLTPPPALAAPAADAPPAVDTPDAWIDRNVVAGWFPDAPAIDDPEGEVMESEDGAEGLGARSSGGPPPPETAAPIEEVERSVSHDNSDGPDTGGGEARWAFGAAFEGDHDSADDSGTDSTRPATWRSSAQLPNASQLKVGDDTLLPLRAFQATVRIDGHRARVVLDLVYENTLDFDAEGSFRLRVPDDAAVHYLAFGDAVAEAPLVLTDLSHPPTLAAAALTGARGGPERMREARLVPRERAQQAYARETARRVDPALMEWSGAGVFTTRVFPLRAGKKHRITVAYDTDLVAAATTQTFALDVPEDATARRVDVFVGDRDLDVRTTPVVPVEDVDAGTWLAFGDTAPRVEITLTRPETTAIRGDDPAIGPHFALSVIPDIPAIAAAPSGRAVFLVDASMSSNPERMNVWIALLGEILERNRADTTEFAVLFFNVERWWWRPELAPNDPATVARLVDDCRLLALEGATDVGAAIREAGAPAWAGGALEADFFLLSDAATTWGSSDVEVEAAALAGPVFSYASGLAGTDTRSLAAIARASGGAVFSVTGAQDVAAAAVAHRARPWTLREIRVPGCEDVLAAGRPATVHPGQRLRIAGRGAPRSGDAVRLVLEQDGRHLDVDVSISRVVSSPLAPRAYGEIATGQLEDLAPLGGDAARSYALHYGVTGKTCSLLMLESEEDYTRHGIVPEDDAAVVRARPVAAVLASLTDARSRAVADPREAFVLLLDRLERSSGVEFDDLDRLRRAVRVLPGSALSAPQADLRARTRAWDDVSRAFREELRQAAPTYDETVREAEGRRSVRGDDDALRALSSLVEAEPGSTDLLRDIALTALAWDRPEIAHGLLLRVADLRPDEPETWRLLAESLERAGKVDAAVLVHEIALRGAWDPRFGAFPLIAATDYLRLLDRIERGDAETVLVDLVAEARARIAEHYLSRVPDLVVTLTWNTDRTDVDLHVIDPAGEECFYGHARTQAGGAITADVTGGFGPEMFVAGQPLAGEYRVDARYYASDQMRGTLRSRAFATIVRRTPEGSWVTERHTLTLDQAKDRGEIARIRTR